MMFLCLSKSDSLFLWILAIDTVQNNIYKYFYSSSLVEVNLIFNSL